MSWTVLEVLNWTTERFRRIGLESPRLDAELLIAYALGWRRIDCYTRFDQPLSAAERTTVRTLVSRRLRHEPIALITEAKEFWSRPFSIKPGVLIPRPDTETLVSAAIRLVNQHQLESICDVGTGTGCVAITLAYECLSQTIVATDIEQTALAVAKENLIAHRMADRITLCYCDLLPEDGRLFDLIVSNPPYIPSEAIPVLVPDITNWEPNTALDGGLDGLSVVRRLISAAALRLNKSGYLLIELSPDQAGQVKNLSQQAGFSAISFHHDLGGRPRVIEAKLSR